MTSAASTLPLTFRPMSGSDIDRAMEIAAQSPTAPHWNRTAYEDAVAQTGSVFRVALVAELDAELAGFVVANIIAAEAEIESVAVAANLQRRGIATRLIHHLIARLRVAGVSRLVLEVRESNTTAQRLYARIGFHQAGRRRSYYHDPSEDALVLEASLA